MSAERASGDKSTISEPIAKGPVGDASLSHIGEAANDRSDRRADASEPDAIAPISRTENRGRSVDAQDSPFPTTGNNRSSSTSRPRAPPTTGDTEDAALSDLSFGILREVSPDRFLSPAGLIYGPGSEQGHRLEHFRRHTRDDPQRPGKHGVFDGGMEGGLQTVDEAFSRAKKGERTTKKIDGDRTVYTVDMGKRVGYVGGRDGGRRRNPMARRVRIVTEGNRLITAYPL